MTNAYETRVSTGRDSFGKLVLTTAEGEFMKRVAGARLPGPGAGPAASRWCATDGKEVGWIDDIEQPAPLRALVPKNWKGASSCPRSCRSTRVQLCHALHLVGGDRPRRHRIRAEGRRRHPPPDSAFTLLISDSHGIHYLIRDAAYFSEYMPAYFRPKYRMKV
jgi:hypothetical protein